MKAREWVRGVCSSCGCEALVMRYRFGFWCRSCLKAEKRPKR